MLCGPSDVLTLKMNCDSVESNTATDVVAAYCHRCLSEIKQSAGNAAICVRCSQDEYQPPLSSKMRHSQQNMAHVDQNTSKLQDSSSVEKENLDDGASNSESQPAEDRQSTRRLWSEVEALHHDHGIHVHECQFANDDESSVYNFDNIVILEDQVNEAFPHNESEFISPIDVALECRHSGLCYFIPSNSHFF